MSGTENTDGLGIWTVVTLKGVQPVSVERRRTSFTMIFGLPVEKWEYVATVSEPVVGVVGDTGFGSDPHEAVMDLISGGPDRDHEVWLVLEVLRPGVSTRPVWSESLRLTERQRAVQIVRDTVKTFVDVLSSRELDRRLRGSEVPAVKSVVGTRADKSIRESLSTLCVEVGNMIIARIDPSASTDPITPMTP